MHAKIEMMGKRIEVHTDPPFRGLDAEIPGAYWSAQKRRWSLPLSMAVCRNVREVFGAELEIGPRLTAWAREEVKAERSQKALGRTLAAVPLPGVEARSPRLAQALLSRPYQTSGARFIAEGRNILIADTPGLGKTTETIAGIVESGVQGPYLVAAPVAAMNDAWEREIIARLGDSARVCVINGTRAQRKDKLDEAMWPGVVDGEPMEETEAKLEVLDRTWVIINIEMIRTRVCWVCPECRAINEQRRAERDKLKPAWEAAMEEYKERQEEYDREMEFWGLKPDADYRVRPAAPVPPEEPPLNLIQERWEASDRPKSTIVDCGHNPRNVETVKEHQYPELFERTWGALIMDECQRILLKNTGKPTQTRTGAMLLESDPEDGLRIALSGTPMRGKPQRLWGVLNWLDRVRFSGYWSWVERFWDVDQSGYGGARVIGAFREDRRDAFEADLDRYMLRRTKDEVSPDLPPKAYMGTPLDPRDPQTPTAVWLPMDPKQAKAYREMLALSSAEVEGGTLQAVGILATMTRLKQFASTHGRMTSDGDFQPDFPSNKWGWLEQWLRERNLLAFDDRDEQPDTKVVIVSQFTSVLNLIGKELRAMGVPYSMVTGEITGSARQRMVDTFETSPNTNILLLNTQAGGVALTLDAGEDMVFLDETHVPDDQEQAEGRIDNRRPEVRVVQRRYWYLKSLGSIDEAIARTNMARDADQKQHLDGRRGVEYARAVFASMKELAERGAR